MQCCTCNIEPVVLSYLGAVDLNLRVGKALRKLRKQRGISRRVASELSGIGEQTIMYNETKSDDMKLTTLLKYCNLFGITLVEMVKHIEKESR